MTPPRAHTRRNRAAARAAWLPVALALLAGTPASLGQAVGEEGIVPEGELSIYENRPVRRLEILVERQLNGETVTETLEGPTRRLAENQIRVLAGAPFIASTVSSDLTRLNRLGRFARVDGGVRLNTDGTVDVVYTVVEQPVIRDVQIRGNTRVRSRDLAPAAALLDGTPIDRFQLDRAAREMEDIYREKGYGRAVIRWDYEVDADGRAVVLYTVTEGERIRVTQVRFQGNTVFSDRELRSAIRTRESALLRRTPLDDDALEQDIIAIRRYYEDRGYLDTEVDRAPPRLSPDGREAIVTFIIREGQLSSLRRVQAIYPDQIVGTFQTRADAVSAAGPGEEVFWTPGGDYAVYRAEPYSSAQIAGLMELKPGDVYSRDKINASIRKIEAAFGSLGFVDVREGGPRFRKIEIRDPEDPTRIDLLLEFYPGRPMRTGEVVISGNTVTRHEVIRRRIDLRPDRPLDQTKVTSSTNALLRSGLFADGRQMGGRPTDAPRITIQPEDPLEPGYRDILVQVVETNTGSINIGGFISSDSGLTGTISLVQRNFDITDPPDSVGDLLSGRSFRGGGQTLNLIASPGTEIQTYRISLSEPSLFDSDYSGSVGFQLRDRFFREYDERRMSVNLRVGRRFGTLWTGSADLRLEDIDISDVRASSPTDIFDVEGKSQLTGLSVGLTRNTIDNPFDPGRGTRLAFAAEQVGLLGGDYDFTKLRAEHNLYLTLDEDFMGNKTTLRFQTEAAYIPQGQSDAPVFERLYRGGRSFRGFNFRAVAPRGVRADTGEQSRDTVGGSWEFFFGTQLKQPIYDDILSMVFFVDTGTVQESFGFDEYRVTAGTGLRLKTPLSPAPIAFDFGFPLVSQGDRERVFTFTIDLPF
ncbi:MAG: hypothetical protein EA423_04890 [Phycisphaerales bacterium]|nr:MAG: hypothetical protein EA423_04890 [Phycisphaerales bacterium]